MEQSSQELGAFVDQVLAATGKSKVDLVGHSEGTVMPRYWMEFDGGAAKVDAPNVTNDVLQDQCSLDFSEHAGVAYDPTAAQDILNALDPAHARSVPCMPVLPALGALYAPSGAGLSQ